MKIKFDVNISEYSVNILDVTVILDDGTLKTILLTKPTDSLIFKLQFLSTICMSFKIFRKDCSSEFDEYVQKDIIVFTIAMRWLNVF